MATIEITINKKDVYDEVSKSTDYMGSKQTGGDSEARDRILAGDRALADLWRLWSESITICNERFKDILVAGGMTITPEDGMEHYGLKLEVSNSFDKQLTGSVKSAIESYLIANITGEWYKYANKEESGAYLLLGAEYLDAAERLLYSRKKPKRPTE